MDSGSVNFQNNYKTNSSFQPGTRVTECSADFEVPQPQMAVQKSHLSSTHHHSVVSSDNSAYSVNHNNQFPNVNQEHTMNSDYSAHPSYDLQIDEISSLSNAVDAIEGQFSGQIGEPSAFENHKALLDGISQVSIKESFHPPDHSDIVQTSLPQSRFVVPPNYSSATHMPHLLQPPSLQPAHHNLPNLHMPPKQPPQFENISHYRNVNPQVSLEHYQLTQSPQSANTWMQNSDGSKYHNVTQNPVFNSPNIPTYHEQHILGSSYLEVNKLANNSTQSNLRSQIPEQYAPQFSNQPFAHLPSHSGTFLSTAPLRSQEQGLGTPQVITTMSYGNTEPNARYPASGDEQIRPTPAPLVPMSFAPSPPISSNHPIHYTHDTSAIHQGHQQLTHPGSAKVVQPVHSRSISQTQPAVFRTPGMAVTGKEWSRLTTPIHLSHERNLLPSDGPDLPIQPALATPINCDLDIMRCTLTNVPSTSKLLAKCHLPLGLVMHPFRDLSSLHTINSTVIVRCRSCRTYINPFVQFLDSGRRWRCPVCFLSNSVPDDFFYDPGTQTYGDPTRRPEIRSATVEFIAPSEYMLRPPQAATYLFCFDVSHNAIATGYLRLACKILKDLLTRIPGDSRRQIAFITYNSGVHFYKLHGETMRMLLCPDLEEIFIPDGEGLINQIDDSVDELHDFLTRLPDSFADIYDTGNCLGSALQASLKLIGSIGGRVTVFNTCLPNIGVGALKQREEPSDRNSVDVKHLGPSIDFYKTFALDCAAQQVCVDMFIFNSQYCDIATISGTSRFSGGAVYHYPDFFYPSESLLESNNESDIQTAMKDVKSIDGVQSVPVIETERFRRDFERYLVRKIGFEAVMRIRCTHGLTIQAFHGSFFVRSTDLMSLPNVSPDAGFAVQLDLSENIDKYATVCCQTAILYTSSKGDRRIRVHTLCLPVVHTPNEVFMGADQGAIACLLSKMAVDRTISSGLSNAREALANAVEDALSAFESTTGMSPTSGSSSCTLVCPPNLRLLPLYVCGLLRFRAFRVGIPTRIDDRSAALERLKSAPPNDVLTLMYPKLYAVHRLVTKPISSTMTLAQKAATLTLGDQSNTHTSSSRPCDCDGTSSSADSDEGEDVDVLPAQLHLTAQSITRSGVFLLDTGEILLLLVGCGDDVAPGTSGNSEILHQLLGIFSPGDLPAQGGPFYLPPLTQSRISEKSDIPVSVAQRRLAALLTLLRRRRPINSALVCMRHDAPTCLRTMFLSCLVEDKTESAPSYQEFLQMIQSSVRS